MPFGSALAFSDASGFADALASSALECSNALAFGNASGFSVALVFGVVIQWCIGSSWCNGVHWWISLYWCIDSSWFISIHWCISNWWCFVPEVSYVLSLPTNFEVASLAWSPSLSHRSIAYVFGEMALPSAQCWRLLCSEVLRGCKQSNFDAGRSVAISVSQMLRRCRTWKYFRTC